MWEFTKTLVITWLINIEQLIPNFGFHFTLGILALGILALGILALGILALGILALSIMSHWVLWLWVLCLKTQLTYNIFHFSGWTSVIVHVPHILPTLPQFSAE